MKGAFNDFSRGEDGTNLICLYSLSFLPNWGHQMWTTKSRNLEPVYCACVNPHEMFESDRTGHTSVGGWNDVILKCNIVFPSYCPLSPSLPHQPFYWTRWPEMINHQPMIYQKRVFFFCSVLLRWCTGKFHFNWVWRHVSTVCYCLVCVDFQPFLFVRLVSALTTRLFAFSTRPFVADSIHWPQSTHRLLPPSPHSE